MGSVTEVLSRKCITLVLVLSIGLLTSQTPVEKYGNLKVSGNKILDKSNNPVVLRGMSFFWSQWMGQYYTSSTVKWLRDDWCCSVVRAAMAVDQGGYATNPAEKQKIFTVIDAAIQYGIYVIVDFHVHEGANYIPQAKTFFAEVAQKYGNVPNIIYEVWNEPIGESWANVIKPYHTEIVQTIRAIDPDNIIVCGTGSWSQNVGDAADNPVTGTNIAYTLHYYANTHGQSLRDACTYALNKNVAIFVTEYGTCSADGGGNVNVNESNAWWSYLDQNKISYCNWSIADKEEAASALKPGASGNGGWAASELTTSGSLVKNYYKSKCDFDITQSAYINTSITSPTNKTTYASGKNIAVNATATVANGVIARLELYVDNQMVSTDSLAPFSFVIPKLASGKHNIYTIAYTNNNLSSTSQVVSIEVLTPVFKTNVPIVVDGVIDSVWNFIPSNKILVNNSGTISNSNDLSATYKALWDANFLYILSDITDDKTVNDSPEIYNDDALELFIDINNDKATTYGANDVQYSFGWNDGTVIVPNPSGRATTGIVYNMSNRSGGYIFEAKIPWSTIKGNPAIGQLLGLDFNINDDDDGDARDGKISWNSPTDDAWQNPSIFGTVVLQDVACTAVPPTPTVSPVTICQYSKPSSLVAVAGNGGTLNWYGLNATGGDVSYLAPVPSTGVAGLFNYYVSQTVGTCESARASLPVTVKDASTEVNVVDSVAYCLGVAATEIQVVGQNINWYSSTNSNTSLGNSLIPSTLLVGKTAYYVTQNINGCESKKTEVIVNVIKTEAPTYTSPVNYCLGVAPVTLTATGTSLKWYLSNVSNASGSSLAPTPNTGTIGVQNFYVSQTLNGCESEKSKIEVNVFEQLPRPVVESPQYSCLNAVAKALVANGSNLRWYTEANGGVAALAAPVPSTKTVGNVTYYVSSLGQGCESERVPVVATVLSLPAAPVVTSPIYYNIGESNALLATGSNLKWYLSSVGGTPTNTAIIPATTTAGSTTYYVSQTNSFGCESPRAAIVVNVTTNLKIYKTADKIVVDGLEDAVWKSNYIIPMALKNVSSGTVTSTNDLSGTFKLLWDNTNLYVFANIVDDQKVNDSPESYNDDAVEIFLDFNNDKATTYGPNDVLYTLGWNDESIVSVTPSDRISTGVVYSIVSNNLGYTLEAKIPWANVSGVPTIGKLLGFDFQVNDDDDGEYRDGKMAWNATNDNAWQNPSLLGTGIFLDIITEAQEGETVEFGVFPNPIKDLLEVSCSGSFEYRLFAFNGLEVSNGGGIDRAGIDVSDLSSGFYVLRVFKNGKALTYKIKKE